MSVYCRRLPGGWWPAPADEDADAGSRADAPDRGAQENGIRLWRRALDVRPVLTSCPAALRQADPDLPSVGLPLQGADITVACAGRGDHTSFQHRGRRHSLAAERSVMCRWLDTVLISLGFRQWIPLRSPCWMLWIISVIRWMVILHLLGLSMLPALLPKWSLWQCKAAF